jgi:hypothetical protein
MHSLTPEELDKIAIEKSLDMAPEADERETERTLVKTPRPGEIWYHGGNKNTKLTDTRPMFFARDKSAARWYAVNFGDDEPVITEYRLNITNPARLRNLLKAVKEVGATEEDIRKNSNYEGYNKSDYLYVPSVVSELKKNGFDGYVGWDSLSNDDIQIAVPFSLKQIKEVKAEMHLDPILNTIACTIGVGCLASGEKTKKSKLPACDGIQKTKRESCIVDVKAKLPAGCTSKNWNKPDGEKPENCVNPFAICTQAVGCRIKNNRKAK